MTLAVLAGCAARPVLSAQDQADIDRIQAYLDGLHGLRARFLQIGADGGTSSGVAWYDPGRLRLDYDQPGRMEVVATGTHLVAHRDSDDSTTRIALASNPLGLLLAPGLRLSGGITVTNIQRRAGLLQASLARTANPAQGLLTLILSDTARPSDHGLTLVGLEAVDARGQRTSFHLIDPEAGLALDPRLFRPLS
ncbi:LolA family protein [Lichenicoccus sp.]|uniref:LolA family protein n=1 Tax=Lichenicoccus sp. TaxID=2781899 RepID=UPI003D0D4728